MNNKFSGYENGDFLKGLVIIVFLLLMILTFNTPEKEYSQATEIENFFTKEGE